MLSSRLVLRVTQRRVAISTTTSPRAARMMTTTTTTGEKEKKAGWFLTRMAPKGHGTEPPDAKFLFIAAIVCGAGYYAWFIEPPVKKEEKKPRVEAVVEATEAKKD